MKRKPKRTTIEVMRDILEVAANGAKFTTIRLKARLNYSMAIHYLTLAHDNGYIQHENRTFLTTEKGNSFIKTANELAMMESTKDSI
jgi:predicted transcriptional regulator